MSESLKLTIVFEQGDGILELRFGEHARATPAPDSESLELTIAA